LQLYHKRSGRSDAIGQIGRNAREVTLIKRVDHVGFAFARTCQQEGVVDDTASEDG
jgi:hypothetical protein